jgi:5'(3')-deoxyribonucleotidase
MKNEKFVLGVDLDGVVANFYDEIRRVAAEWTGQSVSSLPKKITYDLREWDLKEYGGYEPVHRFAVVERHLFEKLKPMIGAASVLRKFSNKDIRIRIITHRLFIKWFHVEAVQQTVKWLEHYGIPYWDLCFMKDKAAVGADLYLEDSPENIKALRKMGNKVIVFSNSTNKHLAGPRAGNWKQVEQLVLKELRQWKTKI